MGHFQTAHVRTDHDQVRQILLFQKVVHHGRGVEMVHRNIEEPLNLLGVQVHRQDAVRPRGHQQVGHQLGGDGHARLVFAVLPGISVKRQHRRDPGRAAARGL